MSRAHLRVFLDTNIVLDALMRREPFADAAAAIFEAGAADDISLQIAATSLKDIFYIYSKHCGQEQAHARLKDLIVLCAICAIDFPVCQDALHSTEPDFEDALVMTSAAFEFSDFLVTRDAAAFKGSEVRKISPDDFVRLML